MELGQRVVAYPRCQNQVWDLTCNDPKSEQFNVIAHRMAYTPKRRLFDRSTFLCLWWWYFTYFPSWGQGGRVGIWKAYKWWISIFVFVFFLPFCIQKNTQHALNEINALMVFFHHWLYITHKAGICTYIYKADDWFLFSKNHSDLRNTNISYVLSWIISLKKGENKI